MGLFSKLFTKREEERGNYQAVKDGGTIKKKGLEVIVVCRTCNHEHEIQIESEGKHIFARCPKCNGPVSSQYDQKGKKYSPTQAAAEAIIKKYGKL